MARLMTVLEGIYHRSTRLGDRAFDPFDPEPSWVRGAFMVRVVRAHFPALSAAGRDTGVDAAQAAALEAAFEVELWAVTLRLMDVAAAMGRRVRVAVREVDGVDLAGASLRAVREMIARRVAAAYEAGRDPSHLDLTAIDGAAVRFARESLLTVLDDAEFVACVEEVARGQVWQPADPPAERLLLGRLTRPPLSDPLLRTVQAGTDRDCYSRYRSYYSRRSRTRHPTPRLQQLLATSDTRQVALHEVRRAAQVYGLAQPAHHDALRATDHAFSLVDRPGLPHRSGEVDRPVDGSPLFTDRLGGVYRSFARHQRSTYALEVATVEAELQQWVMRKLWNDLHRHERETESVAGQLWYLGRLRAALDAWGKEQAPSRRPRPRRAPAEVPPEFFAVVFAMLGAQDPVVVREWVREAAGVAGMPPQADLDAVARAECRRRRWDLDLADVLRAVASRALAAVVR